MVKSTAQKFNAFVKECRRVLKITKKPTRKEFIAIVRVSGLGMLVVGLIGFAIYLVSYALQQGA